MDTTLIGSIIQAFATVITGIAAVAIALRQLRLGEERIIKAADDRQQDLLRSSYSDLLAERRSIIMGAVGDPETTKSILMRFGLGDTPPEERRLMILAMLQVDHYVNVWYRYSRGQFPDDLWPQWRLSMSSALEIPVFKRLLSSNFKGTLPKEFIDFMDKGFPDSLPGKA